MRRTIAMEWEFSCRTIAMQWDFYVPLFFFFFLPVATIGKWPATKRHYAGWPLKRFGRKSTRRNPTYGEFARDGSRKQARVLRVVGYEA